MNRKNRLRGLIVCIVILFSGMILQATPLNEIGMFLIMFSAGYGLRDALDGEIEE